MAAKAAVPNLERFRSIKSRVNDLYESCGDAIRAKKTVWSTSHIFEEMEFLVGEVKRLAGGAKALDDPERFTRVAKFVRRVCEDQAKAIKSGQIIKISAEIFSAMRYLVRVVETVLVALVDDDVAASLTNERMVDEHTDRVQLDLEDGIADVED